MDFTSFARDEWRSEAANDFPWVRCIPASRVQAFLAVILEQKRDMEFLVALVENELSKRALDLLWAAVTEKTKTPRFMGFGEAKGLIALEQDPEYAAQIGTYIDEARALTANLTIPAAEDVQAQLFPLLASAFSSAPEDAGEGHWRFPIQHQGGSLALGLDFAGRGPEFQWHLDLRDSPFYDARWPSLSYEGLMGLGQPYWDQVSTDNLEAVGQVLCAVIRRMLEQIR